MEKVADPDVRRPFSAVWGTAVPESPGLRIPEMFNAAVAGRVRALYVIGEDVAQTDPDSGHVRAALEACELLVCQEIFENDPEVEVLAADWSTLHNKGPYSLLFLDPSSPEAAGVDAVVDLVERGGIVVMDDFTPCEIWPPLTGGRVDALRETWLTDSRFTAVEVMVAPDATALIATKN